eukprot:6172722-Pleurochrysis_carterae.AAC.2
MNEEINPTLKIAAERRSAFLAAAAPFDPSEVGDGAPPLLQHEEDLDTRAHRMTRFKTGLACLCATLASGASACCCCETPTLASSPATGVGSWAQLLASEQRGQEQNRPVAVRRRDAAREPERGRGHEQRVRKKRTRARGLVGERARVSARARARASTSSSARART